MRGAHRGAPGRRWFPPWHFRSPRVLWAAHKRALYLNLPRFVCPPHMNIYRVESTASMPAPHSRNSSTRPLSSPTCGQTKEKE